MRYVIYIYILEQQPFGNEWLKDKMWLRTCLLSFNVLRRSFLKTTFIHPQERWMNKGKIEILACKMGRASIVNSKNVRSGPDCATLVKVERSNTRSPLNVAVHGSAHIAYSDWRVTLSRCLRATIRPSSCCWSLYQFTSLSGLVLPTATVRGGFSGLSLTTVVLCCFWRMKQPSAATDVGFFACPYTILACSSWNTFYF